MKPKMIALAAAALSVFGVPAHGNINRNVDFNVEEEAQERQIVRALEILVRAKALVLDPNTNKLELRQDIIEKLKAQGKLNRAYADTGSFCI